MEIDNFIELLNDISLLKLNLIEEIQQIKQYEKHVNELREIALTVFIDCCNKIETYSIDRLKNYENIISDEIDDIKNVCESFKDDNKKLKEKVKILNKIIPDITISDIMNNELYFKYRDCDIDSFLYVEKMKLNISDCSFGFVYDSSEPYIEKIKKKEKDEVEEDKENKEDNI